ncbi:MAG: hypothetical protein ACLP07_10005 [Terracidiphilus sp.]
MSVFPSVDAMTDQVGARNDVIRAFLPPRDGKSLAFEPHLTLLFFTSTKNWSFPALVLNLQ